MTIDGAIKILEAGECFGAIELYGDEAVEAFHMAINALKCQDNISTLNIENYDTIVLDIDPEVIDISFASNYAQGFAEVFPTKNIIVKVKGIDTYFEKDFE